MDAKLEELGQARLAAYARGLDASTRAALEQNIADIRFPAELKRFPSLLRKHLEAQSLPPGSPGTSGIYPPPASLRHGAPSPENYARGLAEVGRGAAALVLLAGGMGTRLGAAVPKGCIEIGLPSGASLFRLIAGRLRALGAHAGGAAHPPLVVLCSPLNIEPTVRFFREHGLFGLDPARVFLVAQGLAPVLDASGAVLLEAAARVACSPNGNGGVFEALTRAPLAFARAGGAAAPCDFPLLPHLEGLGVRYLHIVPVDNPLVLPCDPHLVGFAAAHALDAVNKVVQREDPGERVGLVAHIQRPGRRAHCSVVEYSDIAPALKTARGGDGGLVFRLANICNHLVTTELVRRTPVSALPWHLAHKSCRIFDPAAGEAGAAMAWKMERFVFDIFSQVPMERFGVFDADRRSEFSPIKNNAGDNSPETARRDVLAVHARWLGLAGFEVLPETSYNGEGLGPTIERLRAGAEAPGVVPVPEAGAEQ